MRFGGPLAVKKEYRLLPGCTGRDGRPLTVLGAAVSPFFYAAAISKIVVTVPPDRENAEGEARAALPEAVLPGTAFVRGGETRHASVYRALRFLQANSPCDYVLIHDGARPWVSPAVIEAVVTAAIAWQAAIPVLPAVDTPKMLAFADGQDGALAGFIDRHLRRETVVFAQTPQGFAFEPLLEAHEHTVRVGAEFSDDAGVWSCFWPKSKIAAVAGDRANKKITFPEDVT
jgi:2-C-methyl-D-erythritol 4-phosphate cytidylyltransferase/2-C-methyl-D-erythritol 4-phosphate cytidylyltransferase/2-C-methyl-D-erythritol 2,4-cyclodiphosphate synthase